MALTFWHTKMILRSTIHKGEGHKIRQDGTKLKKLRRCIVRQRVRVSLTTRYFWYQVLLITAGLCSDWATWQCSLLLTVNLFGGNLFLAEGLPWCCWFSFHAVFKTICDVQIHVIDINDQIPIFERSDVSIFNTVFDVPTTFDKRLSIHSMSIERHWETSHLQDK